MATPTQLERGILAEISDPRERLRLATTPTRMLADEPAPPNILNNTFGIDPLGYLPPANPSPDEIIIRQRGRRRKVKLVWSPDKCPAPSRCPFPKTPTKLSISMTLRSSPRKRLLDGLSFQTTPEKANKKTPIKHTSEGRLRPSRTSTTPHLKRLVLDDSDSAQYSKRPRWEEPSPKKNQLKLDTTISSPEYNIKSQLNLMSHKQLVNMVLTMINHDPQAESLVREVAPKPDLSDFYDDLTHILRQIHRNYPRTPSRCITPSMYSRFAPYLKDFKQTILTQCTRLYNANQWDLLLDYHQKTWSIVRSLPVWDNAKHDATRKQCFKFLCSMFSVALKNCVDQLGVNELEKFGETLQIEVIDSEDVAPILEEIKELIGKVF